MKQLISNPLNLTDVYKDSHYSIIPEDVSEMGFYYEVRGGEYPYQKLFGLQYILQSYLEGEFVTDDQIDFQREIIKNILGSSFPFNYSGWKYIRDEYNGRLPIEIKAVREGLSIPVKNVMFKFRSTGGPKTAWIAGWLESLLEQVWYGSTVCTKSSIAKEIIRDYLNKSSDSLDSLPYQLHDFGFRGVSSVESAAIGGAAHLVNFVGSDTKVALDLISQFYYGNYNEMKSVVATEHSIMTLRGKENEAETVKVILDKFPTGIVSIVGDSYDIYNFAENILGLTFQQRIFNRVNGRIVLRPDSGEPTEVLPRLLEILASKFGYSVNTKGYKVLSPVIGIIWGDGLDMFSINRILDKITSLGWSAENIVFGMGGGLLQKLNRDTQKVAIKCCYAIRNGEFIEVYKNPITDSGKKSKKGNVGLVYVNEGYRTIESSNINSIPFDILERRFLNGKCYNLQTFEQIRSN